MAPISTYIKVAAVGFAICYVYGLLAGLLVIGPMWIFGKLPEWSWWHYALAPLALGAVLIAGESLLEPVTGRTRETFGHITQTKKAIFLGALVILMVAYTFFYAGQF